MRKKADLDRQAMEAAEPQEDRTAGEETDSADKDFKVEDRRHWADGALEDAEDASPPAEPARPTVIDEYRRRAESAEQKLQDYIEAFKTFREEQDNARVRRDRDIDRAIELKFGELVGELLESMDNLDLALEHASGVPEAEPLARGVELARNRFLSALERNGVEKIEPNGSPFDPRESEAMRVDPVDDEARDGAVTETMQAGYKLGELVIRPARVAVGRYKKP